MSTIRRVTGVAAVVFLVTAGEATAAPITFLSSGATPAAIQPTVLNFQTALGALNANVAGSFGSGRREINWDGVPDASAAPNNLAPNFFNVNSPRGAVLSTPGTALQVSANAAVGTVEFGNINATYPSQFQAFSPQRLFTAIGSNIVDVTFFTPGTTTPALTRGFGAVFTDVETANVSSITFFNASNVAMDTIFVPASVSEGLSFLGGDYSLPLVSRVRIISGAAALGANDATTNDVAVMDDFIYGEPTPEPTAIGMMAIGAAGVLARRRRRST